jgi:hypothetical protein
MKKNMNLVYLLAGGVAIYLIVRAMRKKGDDANFSGDPFLYATGRRGTSDPCGCYGTAGTSSRGTVDRTLSDGTVICTNSYGYTYACSPTGKSTSLLSL